MIEIGRLCMKTAGRDAGKTCVVVDVLDNNLVMVDGQTRRRKCNIRHLEPLAQTVKLSKGASHDAVVKALSEIKITVVDSKSRESKPRPRKVRKVKVKPEPKKKAPKKAAKKASKKVTKKAEATPDEKAAEPTPTA